MLDPEGGFGSIASDAASDAAFEENMEEAARVLLGGDDLGDKSAGPAGTPGSVRTASNPEQWIDGYASYNVVANTQFANSWKKYSDGTATFDESIGHRSVRGNLHVQGLLGMQIRYVN